MKASLLPLIVLSAVVALPVVAEVPDGTGAASTAQAADSGAAASAPAGAKPASQQDGILMEKGVVYSVHDGQRRAVENEMRLPDGTVIRKNGTVTFSGGANLKLEEGQLVTGNGQVISAKDRAASTSATTNATSTTTDHPGAPVPAGQTSKVEPSSSSPTGATRNLAPVRGGTATTPPVADTSSASGLTTPGATSGSSLGSGSNSTTSKDPSHPTPAK